MKKRNYLLPLLAISLIGATLGGASTVLAQAPPPYHTGNPLIDGPGNASQKCGDGLFDTTSAPQYHEECDDGNNIDGDGCDSKCRLERVGHYHAGVCGNGIKETGENCDDGNTLNGDGCNSTCQLESTSLPGGGKISCEVRNACGNGRVDIQLGEQCDDGLLNGTASSSCRDNCLLKSSPSFNVDPFKKNKNIAWWGESTDYKDKTIGYSGYHTLMDFGRQEDSHRADGSLPYAPFQEATSAKDASKKGRITVTDRGQRVLIPYVEGAQFNGALLTGQSIDKINTYPEKKIVLHAVFSPYDHHDPTRRWDDDFIGFLIGVKPGDQEKPANKDNSYLMITWNSDEIYNGGRANVRRDLDPFTPYNACSVGDSGAVKGKAYLKSGDNNKTGFGLHLYQVRKAPMLLELWQGESCGRGTLDEISLAKGDINKVENHADHINTFFAYDNKLVTDTAKERLQITIEFSETNLLVKVNGVPVIDVSRKDLEKGGRYKWPTSGQLAYYFLGMDNIVADFRGYAPQLDPSQNGNSDGSLTVAYDDLEKATSTVCHGYCGDGVVDAGEQCDDGNRVDGDGCSSTCKIELKPEVCRDLNGALVCYGGTIETPSDRNTDTLPKKPMITGTYVGDPAKIEVIVRDDKGDEVCRGDAKKLAMVEGSGATAKVNVANDGLWDFDSKTECKKNGQVVPLDQPGKYKVEAKFYPPGEKNDPTQSLKAGPHRFEISDDSPDLHVTSPAGYKPSGSKTKSGAFPVTGTVKPGSTVKIKLCDDANPPVCNETSPTPDSKGAFKADMSAQPKKKYTLTVTAEKNGKTEVVTKEVITDDVKPQAPDIDSPLASGNVIGNGDNTVTIYGHVPSSPTDVDPKTPEYVKVVVSDGTKTLDPVVVRVNKDGSYELDLPLAECTTPDTGCDIYVDATSIDKAGNESKPTSTRFHVFPQKGTIVIRQPADRGEVSESAVKSNGDKLKVKGEINAHQDQEVNVALHPVANDGACDTSKTLSSQTVIAQKGKFESDLDVSNTTLKKGTKYCVEAEFPDAHQAGEVTPSPAKTQSIFTYSTDDRALNRTVDRPAFVTPDPATKHEIDNTGYSFNVTVKAQKGSNIKPGDTAEVRLGDDIDHPLAVKTCVFEKVGTDIECTVNFSTSYGTPATTIAKTTEIHARAETPGGSKSDWAEFPTPSESNKNTDPAKDTPAPTILTSPVSLWGNLHNPKDDSVIVTLDAPKGVTAGDEGEVIIGKDPDAPLAKKLCYYRKVGTKTVCTVAIPKKNERGEDITTKDGANTVQARAKANGKNWSPWTSVDAADQKLDGVTVKYADKETEKVVIDVSKVTAPKFNVGDIVTVVANDGSEASCVLDANLQCVTTKPFVNDTTGKPYVPGVVVGIRQNGKRVGWTPVTEDAPSTNNNPGSNNNPGTSNGSPDPSKTGVTLTDAGGGKVHVTVDPKEVPGAKVGDKVTLTDGNNGPKVCTLKQGSNGYFTCDLTLTNKDLPRTHVKISKDANGAPSFDGPVVISRGLLNGFGLVSGGCACSSSDTTPESGLVSLLFAALGIVGIRRRRRSK